MKDKDKTFLSSILKSNRPSGNEENGVLLMDDRLSKCGGFNGQIDNMWNVTAQFYLPDTFPSEYGTDVMLSAHLDEIGFQVVGIRKSGMIAIRPLGGIDKRTLTGTKIVFENGIEGIISTEPLHTMKDKNSLPDFHNFLVDVGARNEKEVKTVYGLEIGDTATYVKDNYNIFFGTKHDLIVGPGLDDGVGLFIIQQLAKELKQGTGYLHEQRILHVCCLAQEEVGLRGAGVVAGRINPQLSIDIDVTVETGERSGLDKNKYGNITVGKGVVIEIGPSKSRSLGKEFIRLAKVHKIPYQVNAYPIGKTNTGRIQLMAENCATMLLSIPCRNIHTPNEICSWKDIESCVKLLRVFFSGR